MEKSDCGVIKRLDEVVVNRIAAGEVIQRPSNAIKEMLENSLDAGSTSINITIKCGGLKMLKIVDNGHGIQQSDMAIVCERFTTSKLRDFDDLKSINTFGFRGEALASISHVGHLSITSKTKSSKCAYKGNYIDGKLHGSLQPCAGNIGTQIVVEDLFYNVPTRRKAFKNDSEEQQKIANVVSRYSIHNSGISFTLRKADGGKGNILVQTQVDATIQENVSSIYGSHIGKELLAVSRDDSQLKVKLNGYVTNANCSLKKIIFLLFVNNRLIDCPSLKHAIETIYQNYLPKGCHPFCYLSLHIPPNNLDVNVHPTKYQVHFLNEEEITDYVCKSIESKLLSCDASRTFYTQKFLSVSDTNKNTHQNDKATGSNGDGSCQKKVNERHLVRVDDKLQKMDAFLNRVELDKSDKKRKRQDSPSGDKTQRTISKFRKRRQIRLTSVLQLQDELKTSVDQDLLKVFRDHTFVGVVNAEFALIQHATKLYLSNTTKLSEELFYQILISDFGNFAMYRLSEPAPIYELAILGLNSEQSGWTPADGNKTDLAHFLVKFYCEKSDMLKDYFSFDIQDGAIKGVPLLLNDYIPPLEGLAMLVLRLATEVNWEDEKECFVTLSREIAKFYSVRRSFTDFDDARETPTDGTSIEAENTEETSNETVATTNWKWTIEHVVYRSIKQHLCPSAQVLSNAGILQLANLPDLYKVFERC